VIRASTCYLNKHTIVYAQVNVVLCELHPGGKVLAGVLTPVTVFAGVTCENGVDTDAENSAWDTLLSG